MTRIILTVLLAAATMAAPAQKDKQSMQLLKKLLIAEDAIKKLYVEKVDEGKLVDDAIRGMLEKLDPHSAYLTEKETKASNEPLSGKFEGIGISYNIMDDTLLVLQPVTDGPSEKAGIMAGDRIITVNDTAIAGVKMQRSEITKKLRGPKGTTVRLGVRRSGIKDMLTFDVVRDKIPMKSVDAAYMIRPAIGYVGISNFGMTTPKEFEEAVKTLKKEGMESLILDLRGNGGGYLQAAVEVASEIINEGELVVYTQGRVFRRTDYKSRGKGSFRMGNVAVLIDEFSASAAEIVTGAIQDQDRGIVVGRRSFGKGLVQRPVDLPDGSSMRVTVSHYYTPSGRCIQKPYVKGDKEAYRNDVTNRLKHGELTNADSIHFADSLKYRTLKLQRTVYGGGGVMPDFFVPLDTLKTPRLFRELSARGIVMNASLKYMDRNRKRIGKQYKAFDDYMKHFEVPQSEVDSILAEGRRQKIEYDDTQLEAATEAIRLQMKAIIARDIWDTAKYMAVINEENNVVMKAVELLEKAARPADDSNSGEAWNAAYGKLAEREAP